MLMPDVGANARLPLGGYDMAEATRNSNWHQETLPRRSRLVHLGVTLIVLQLLAPPAVGVLLAAASHPLWKSALYVLQDLIRVGFFVGVACWTVGAMRNRRWKQEMQGLGSTPPPRS
jgi:hypothetical protein